MFGGRFILHFLSFLGVTSCQAIPKATAPAPLARMGHKGDLAIIGRSVWLTSFETCQSEEPRTVGPGTGGPSAGLNSEAKRQS